MKMSFTNNCCLCAAVVLTYVMVSSDAQLLRKEAYVTVPQLIVSSGYPAEKHRARTEDGYILQLHRIPAGRRTARRSGGVGGDEGDGSSGGGGDGRGGKGKKAVLVVHGLVGSSGDFVIMGPDRSLAYVLADSGYDVWLGNLRGNYYTAHQNLTRSDPAFWDYSFHEHGKYDLPAMIDKVLQVTGLERVLYIGYSMGTTSFFVMASERPEYNAKVIAFVALAPAVYLDNVRSLAVFGLKTMNFANSLRSRGMYSITVRREIMELVIGGVCNVREPRLDLCLRIVYSIVGEDYEQNDWDMSPVILARFQPASLRQLEHFGKIAITGVFTAWEDGLSGAVRPYNLANVKVPVTLLYGANDQLTEKSQVQRLAVALNATGMLQEYRPACAWPKFNHLDFVFARDVGKLLNYPLMTHLTHLFNKYDRND